MSLAYLSPETGRLHTADKQLRVGAALIIDALRLIRTLPPNEAAEFAAETCINDAIGMLVAARASLQSPEVQSTETV